MLKKLLQPNLSNALNGKKLVSGNRVSENRVSGGPRVDQESSRATVIIIASFPLVH